MIPYALNRSAIEDFKRYHKVKSNREVAVRFGISETYFSLLLTGKRSLNEELRWRIQKATSKSQDELFIPQNLPVDPYPHQATAYAKFKGILPYNQYSPSEEFRKLDLDDEDRKILGEPRKRWFSKNIFSQ